MNEFLGIRGMRMKSRDKETGRSTRLNALSVPMGYRYRKSDTKSRKTKYRNSIVTFNYGKFTISILVKTMLPINVTYHRWHGTC